MRLKNVISGAVLALSLTGGPAMAAGDFDALYKQAEAARAKAASVGGEWRDIGKILKKAKKAAADKKMDVAMKLAAKAKFQGEQGYKQAMAQKGKDLTPAYLSK